MQTKGLVVNSEKLTNIFKIKSKDFKIVVVHAIMKGQKEYFLGPRGYNIYHNSDKALKKVNFWSFIHEVSVNDQTIVSIQIMINSTQKSLLPQTMWGIKTS